MNYLVEVKNLKKNYSSKEAVKNISFSIKEKKLARTIFIYQKKII